MPPNIPPEQSALPVQCNLEMVHAPGGIQPAGCLLSLDDELTKIVQVSANIEQILGISVSQALDSPPSRLLGARLVNRLRQELRQGERLPGTLTIYRQIYGRRCRFRMIAYRHRQRVLIELERVSGMEEQRLLPAVNEWLPRITRAETEGGLLQLMVEAVRSLTGHDRVMVCRFAP